MQRGSIKKLADRGFGFVRDDVDGSELFFHLRELANCRFEDLYEGAPVEFEKGFDERRKKFHAANVRLL